MTTVATTAPPAVVAQGLHKDYHGATAVEAIDLTIPAGQIFGLVGPDGAGKSTVLKIFSGLTRPTRGRSLVLGHNIAADPEAIRGHVGFMPQGLGLVLSGKLSVRQNIDFFADLYHVDHELARRRAEATPGSDKSPPVPAATGQPAFRWNAAETGTMLHAHPPSANPDPRRTDYRSRSRFTARSVDDNKRPGGQRKITVIIATSYLDEAERCHRVALVHQGRILLEGDPIQLQAKTGKKELSDIFTDLLALGDEQAHVRANLDRLAATARSSGFQEEQAGNPRAGADETVRELHGRRSRQLRPYARRDLRVPGAERGGKTPAIRMLCGLLPATSGAASIDGYHITRHRRLKTASAICARHSRSIAT